MKEKMMSEPMLHVFTNGTDTVVAHDLADAQAVVEEAHGTTFEQEGWSIDDWEQVAGDMAITINLDHDGGVAKQTMTASEWAAESGRSFLCSTEC